MRLLYLTDTHIRGTSPRSRLDDFVRAVHRKLEEVTDIVRKEQVDILLHGGDVFDRPNLSPAVVRDFIKLFRTIDIPIYAVAGNHDIYGHNPLTIERTMLGLLEASGIVTLLKQGDPIVLTCPRTNVRIQLSGQPFHHELDKRDPGLDYSVQRLPDVDFVLHIVHGMLVERALPDTVAHTMLDQVWFDDVDVLLTGHYHTGFATQHKNDRYIINPGALSRINNSISEINRKPKVVLIECTDELNIKEIPLQSAAPGQDILDRTYIESMAYREEKLADFVQQVRAANDFRGVDADAIYMILESIAKENNICSSVLEEARRRIALVQERAEAII